MLESKIEKDSVNAAKKAGWFSFKLLSTLFRALPDRIFIDNGKVVFIEYKQIGKHPTKLQNKVHAKFLKHGITVYIARSVEDTMEILNNA